MHDDEAAVALRPLPDAEQRAHPVLSHRGFVENPDRDAELAQSFDALGEFLGEKDVRRLVDEIARELDALGGGEALDGGRARRRKIADADDDRRLFARFVVRLGLAGLVFVEPVAAETHAEREIRRGGGVPASRRRLEGDVDLLGARELAQRKAAERREIDRRAVLAGRDADDEKPRRTEAGGRQDVEGGALRAAELRRLGGLADQAFRVADQRADGGGDLEIGADENDIGAAFGRGQGAKGDLDSFAHPTLKTIARGPRMDAKHSRPRRFELLRRLRAASISRPHFNSGIPGVENALLKRS